MIEKRISQTIRPVDGPMNLNEGKPSPKDIFLYTGLSLVNVVAMALDGAWLVWLTPKHFYDWTWYSPVGMLAGILIALFTFRSAWYTQSFTFYEWQAYHDRKHRWNEVQLKLFEQQNGVETVTEVSQLELSPQLASHVLITALAIQHRLETQDVHQALWSVRALEEKLYLDGGSNSVLIGELTGTKPEQMSLTLAQLGLVKNRREGVAGEWIPQSYNDVFALISKNWNKRRG